MLRLSAFLGGAGFVHQVLIGDLTDGSLSFSGSMGLLTTGLYVPFAMVLPYVFAFYLVLSFVEDTGYLPRLAVLLDGLMHRVGLHGMGVIPILLGLGCNVPGALATRIMETRRERFIAMTLIAICTPCMAKTSMIVGLAGRYGVRALAPIFLTLFAAWLGIGFLLGRFLKGESPEILVDIPPYRMPQPGALAKKLEMRMLWFFQEAVPWVLAGVLLVNVLHSTGAVALAGRVVSPVFRGLLGLPEEAVAALIVGLLRKDVAVGMLAPLHLDLRQTVVACVVLAMYFPCVATCVVMLRELGLRDTVRSGAIMIGAAFSAGAVLNAVFPVVGT
jgi:ferrous iron transport protein B